MFVAADRPEVAALHLGQWGRGGALVGCVELDPACHTVPMRRG
jgi:hypothetical protein